MRHRLTILALTSVALLVAACGSSDAATDATSTTAAGATTTTVAAVMTTASTAPTTAPTTAPPTTTAATTTTAAGGMNGAATPEAAAKGLYAAWKAGDKTAAAAVADPAAVTKIFERSYTGPDLQFVGCEADGAVWACAYYYEGGARSFRVKGTATTGYRVAEINDIAD